MGCIEAQWIGGGGLTQCGSCAVRAKRAVDQGVLEPSMQLDMRILGSWQQAEKTTSMNKIYDTYRPEGFGTVNGYLFAENPKELIEFLKKAFYAEEVNRSTNPENGDIANVILKIGTSCFMISQARGQFLNMRTAFYLYVANVDEMHKRAVENGAKVEFEPANMDYQDRQSGIIDPSGNYWWISKRLVEKGYNE